MHRAPGGDTTRRPASSRPTAGAGAVPSDRAESGQSSSHPARALAPRPPAPGCAGLTRRLRTPQSAAAPSHLWLVVDLTEVEHVALHHPPADQAPVFHYAPVRVNLAILLARAAPQKHDGLP